jgi:nicotinate dehydrogenase subunit B
VRAIWVPGPGSYGRNDAGDAAMDAALLSKLTGKPVRVQYMREEGTGWDPKGPAAVYRGRAGLDARGHVVAYEFFGKGFTRQDVATNESDPKDTLAGQLTGFAPKPTVIFQVPAEAYEFANKRCGWECVAPLLDRASPLRTGHLRDPLGPETHFASESFIDEVAHAAGADPVAFRLTYVRDPRHAAVIKAAAQKAGWQPRAHPNPRRGSGPLMVGRGFSYTERNGTVVAMVAEVEVDRRSGRVWARRFTVAHDCGLIINPQGLELTIEGNIVQALSRTLFEEVAFDPERVLSVDWASYPILEIQDAPEARPDRVSGQQYFADVLNLAEAADELGYDSVKIVEHYFTSYGGYSPDPCLFLAACSQRARRMRMVTGAVLPVFNHPLKLAGQLTMLDAISGGRLDAGIARAFMPYEFDAFGVSMEESRAP